MGSDDASVLVREVMTRNPKTIGYGQGVRAAIATLATGKFRHLPVVDDGGALVGILSQADVLAAMPSMCDPSVSQQDRDSYLGFMAVEKLMRRSVVTVTSGVGIVEAARLMRTHRVNCLPVVEDDGIVGIVTSYDLLGALESVRI